MGAVSRDRGQLILIAGVVVAIVLVGTVAVLNAAIDTESLATRSAGGDTSDATEFRNVVIDGSTEILDGEGNDAGRALDQFFTQIERQYAEDATVVAVECSNTDDSGACVVTDTPVEIDLRYRTPDLRYEDTVTIEVTP